jgi:phosphoribosyl-ATP pyrophosphohydrolase
MNLDFLTKLTQLLSSRRATVKEGSYTSELFSQGIDRILKKVGEEAGEVIIAAKNADKEELSNEAADLLFHLMMALEASDLTLADVVSVLEKRHSK